jgi:hypothetical protein
LAEPCKSWDLCSWHGTAETSEADWFTFGPSGLGCYNKTSEFVMGLRLSAPVEPGQEEGLDMCYRSHR